MYVYQLVELCTEKDYGNGRSDCDSRHSYTIGWIYLVCLNVFENSDHVFGKISYVWLYICLIYTRNVT